MTVVKGSACLRARVAALVAISMIGLASLAHAAKKPIDDDFETIMVANAPSVSISCPYTVAVQLGQSLACTATAVAKKGSITKVEFFASGDAIGPASAGTPPNWSFSWNAASANTYDVLARATDSNGFWAYSNVVRVIVNAPPVITIAASPNAVAPGQVVTLTGNAYDNDPGDSIQSVEYFQATTSLGTGSGTQYSKTWTAPTPSTFPSTYSFTGRAKDTRNGTADSAPATVTVTQAPVVALTSPLPNALITTPSPVHFAATASDADGTVSRVDFLANGNVVGSATGPTFVFDWTAPYGTYSLTARAYDNYGVAGTSSAVPIIVNAPPAVALTSPQNGARPAAITPISIPLKVVASDPDGTVSSVAYTANGVAIGSSATAPDFAASWSVGPVSVDTTYAIVATATDNRNATASSAPATITLKASNDNPVVTVVTSPASPILVNTSPQIIATAADGDGSVTKVELAVDGTLIAAPTSAPYSTTWSANVLGTHAITAKAFDNSGGTTTATYTAIVQANSPPVATITSPADGGSSAATTTVVAKGTDPDGNLSKIGIVINGSEVYTATVSGSSATASYTLPGAGTYVIQSKVYDAYTSTLSAPQVFTVLPKVAQTPPNLSNAVAGTLPGVAAVSPTGAATYSIPISVPMGTAGVVPQLALQYSSQAGDGLLGAGWMLTGLSKITRCPQDIARDGQRRALDKNSTLKTSGIANDRFCLDGQRLILVGGKYGEDGSEYRTEIDSVSKIVAHVDLPTDAWIDVSSFKVQTKDGRILTYGIPALTDQHHAFVRQNWGPYSGDTAIEWELLSVEDRSGNYYQITYGVDQTTNDSVPQDVNLRPLQIDYTGNKANGQPTYAKVTFTYETRPDRYRGFEAGVRADQAYRLTTISTYTDTDSAAANRYVITYTQDSSSNRSLVSSIALCDGGSTCLPATSFAWTQHAVADNHFNVSTWTGPIVNFGTGDHTFAALQTDVLFGDFDGDGKIDLLQGDGSGSWKFFRSNGSGFDTAVIWSGPTVVSKKVLVGDYNGDGLLDLAVPKIGTSTTWTVCLNNGHGFNSCSPGNWGGDSPVPDVGGYVVGDFNGDGRDDILSKKNTEMCFSTGVAFNCVPYGNTLEVFPPSAGDGNSRYIPYLGDFNGDGRTDIGVIIDDGSTAFAETCLASYNVNEVPPDRFDCQRASDVYPSQYMTLPQMGGGTANADINGDGTTDMVISFVDPSGTASGAQPMKICRSSGTAFRPLGSTIDMSAECTSPAPPTNPWDSSNLFVGDFDGDGRPDSLHFDRGTFTWKVCQLSWSGQDSVACADWGSQPAFSVGLLGPFFADFDGDGKVDMAFYDGSTSTSAWTVALANGSKPALLQKVTDGYGAVTQFAYKPLTASGIYTAGSSVAYPAKNVRDSTYVVATLKQDNGLGATPSGTVDTTFAYAGQRIELTGRGSLGFQSTSLLDPVSHVTTQSQFSQTFPYTGLLANATKTHASGVTLSSVSNTLADLASYGGRVHLPYIQASSVTQDDLDGSDLPAISTQTAIDVYGNVVSVLQVATDASEQRSTYTQNTYASQNPATWLVANPTSVAVTACPSAAVGSTLAPLCGSAITRTTAYSYDSLGRLASMTLEPTNSALSVTHTYSRQAPWGLISDEYLNYLDPFSGLKTIHSLQLSSFDSRGRFAGAVTDAAGATRAQNFDVRNGQKTLSEEIPGVQTTYTYDSFGRRTAFGLPDGTVRYTDYRAYSSCGTSCPAEAKSTVISRHLSGSTCLVSAGNRCQVEAPRETYLDRLGRTVLTQSWGFDGTEVRARQVWDSTLRLSQASRNYFNNGTAPDAGIWTTYSYDDLGRVTGEARQNEAGVSKSFLTAFNGESVTTTDELGHKRTVYTNTIGKRSSVTDALNSKATYKYDPFGNLTQMMGPDGVTVNVVYDNLGRKIYLDDPDLGPRTYVVDPIGQVRQQKDARSQLTTYTYDDVGRLKQRDEPYLTSTWIYDSTCMSGRLCQANTTDGYTRDVTYDGIGRVAQVATTIGGKVLTDTTTYDDFGNLQADRYQAGDTRTVVVARTLNSNGYLASVSSQYGTHWTATARDPLDQLASLTLGNGVVETRTYNAHTARLASISAGPSSVVEADAYTYDDVGNVLSRQQRNGTVGTISESFTYDALDRLSSSTVATQPSKSYAFDPNGNLLSKDGMIYSYGGGCAGQLCPHAVKSVSGTVNATFAYDANGNMTLGNGAAITWSAANMPTSITTAGGADNFRYGPERQIALHGIGSSQSIYYAGALQAEVATGSDLMKVYLPQSAGFISVDKNGAALVRYYHTDNLGSVIAITDETGSATGRYYSYDPWGKRRNLNGSDDLTNTISNVADRQGFTGHEELDATRFVHMKGRVYAPLLARFISPDTEVTNAGNWATYNRYGYVRGNPLKWIDPSGHADFSVQLGVATADLADMVEYVFGRRLRDPSAGGYFGLTQTFPAPSFARWALTSERLGSLVRVAGVLGADAGIGTCIASVGCAVVVGAVVGTGVVLVKIAEVSPATVDQSLATAWDAANGVLATSDEGSVAGNAEAPGAKVPSSVGPGPNAKGSVPVGPTARPTREEQEQINEIGNEHGCHTCGAKDPGTKSGDWVGDHQAPNKLNPDGTPQRYYPQCLSCSNQQGGRVRWMSAP